MPWLVIQSSLTLCDPMDCSPPVSCPWGFSRQEYWSGCHALLQGILPTPGSNPDLPHCRQILHPLSYLEQGSVQFCSVQSCPAVCNPMDCSTPGVPVHHQLPELTQTHVHRVSDAIQPSQPLSSPAPPALNLSQNQESPAEARVGRACCRVRGTECSSASMGPFEEGHHYLPHLHHSLASGQATGRNIAPPNTKKLN